MRNIAKDPHVQMWVAARQRDGWKRDRIVAASKSGSDGWPLPGESLSNGTFSVINHGLAMAAGESLEPPARPRKRSGKRMRDLREQQKSFAEGDARHRLVKLQMDLQKTTNLLELTDVEKIVRDNSAVMGDAMRRLHEDLADLQTWLDYVFEHVRAHMDDAAKLDVIRRLREDTAGRTEAEIATANRLADHLERKIHARLMRR